MDKISPIKLFDENKTVSGFSVRTLLFRQGRHELARDIVHRLFQMYNDGKIRPKIDSAWAFEDVRESCGSGPHRVRRARVASLYQGVNGSVALQAMTRPV